MFFSAGNQNIRMISEGSCDRSNDAKNLGLITGINYILKYIQIEIFHNITALAVFWIK